MWLFLRSCLYIYYECECLLVVWISWQKMKCIKYVHVCFCLLILTLYYFCHSSFNAACIEQYWVYCIWFICIYIKMTHTYIYFHTQCKYMIFEISESFDDEVISSSTAWLVNNCFKWFLLVNMILWCVWNWIVCEK